MMSYTLSINNFMATSVTSMLKARYLLANTLIAELILGDFFDIIPQIGPGYIDLPQSPAPFMQDSYPHGQQLKFT